MSRLRPDKLHVRFGSGVAADGPITPRRYTLTHSDATGDLYLTIGSDYDRQQISGVHFHATQPRYNRTESWGVPADYLGERAVRR